jgi:hypothetical protein
MRAPRRTVALALALTALAAACGIQPDAEPRDLPEEQRRVELSGGSTGTDAAGADRIYLVAPGENRLLRSVPRDAQTREDLIKILLLGPNDDELVAQYSSFIPPATELLSSRLSGQRLILDLSDGIAELTGQSLSQAIAQIVYTATEIDGVETVQIDVEGEEIAWPTPAGDPKTNLRIYDYPGFVQTAQPDYPAVPAGA